MKEKFKLLKVIHFAICAGLILAYLFIGEPTTALSGLTDNHGTWPFFLIPTTALVLSGQLFRYYFRKINLQQPLDEQLNQYQTAVFIRWVVLELAALAILIIWPHKIIFALPIVIYLIYIRPTEKMFLDHIEDLKNNPA